MSGTPLAYVLALLAAVSNAGASVMQRRANRDEPEVSGLSLRLVLDALRHPGWVVGFGGVLLSFVLQAAALSFGPLAAVQPVLSAELPATLVIAALVFHRRLQRRDVAAAVAMSAALGGLLFSLSPTGGHATGVSGWLWGAAIAAGVVALVVLISLAYRSGNGSRRAALLGAAVGTSFGMTAAFMSAASAAAKHGGVSGLFLAWQTYATALAGLTALVLLQHALAAGTLVAAQPGITTVDPLVSILWGVVLFDEHVVVSWSTVVPAIVCAVALVGAAVALSRSPLVSEQSPEQLDPGSEAAPAH